MIYRSSMSDSLAEEKLVDFTKNIILHGPTGVGKAEVVLRLAEKNGQKDIANRIFGEKIFIPKNNSFVCCIK